MDIDTGIGVRRANPKSFQLVVNKKGKKSILFQGELFYRRYVLQDGYCMCLCAFARHIACVYSHYSRINCVVLINDFYNVWH